jgi:pimeloyl-ACP methyl ester carboxylesterase
MQADAMSETQLQLVAPDGVPLDARLVTGSGESGVSVLLVHGITATMDEGTMFARLALKLGTAGYDNLRFSFRGHGYSGGTPEGVTVAGEMLDLLTAYKELRTRSARRTVVVGSSFGAVSTLLMLDRLAGVEALTLWNPVLDLRDTFLEPHLQWGRSNFSNIWADLDEQGYVDVDGSFRLGPVLFAEMSSYSPLDAFLGSKLPALVVHGDRDESVSYDIARRACEERAGAEFITVHDSDHGFDDHEDVPIESTLAWINERFKRT